MNFMTKLFNKPKKIIMVKKSICNKHGEMFYFCLSCQNKEYPVCGHCLGEFLSENCKVEVIEKAQEK